MKINLFGDDDLYIWGEFEEQGQFPLYDNNGGNWQGNYDGSILKIRGPLYEFPLNEFSGSISNGKVVLSGTSTLTGSCY